MTRAKWILRAIERDKMAENAHAMGVLLVSRLAEVGKKLPDRWVSNARGRGTLVAFDCPSKEARDQLLKGLTKNRMLALACGDRSVRFRPPLNVSKPDVDRAIEILGKALGELGVAPGASVGVLSGPRAQAASGGKLGSEKLGSGSMGDGETRALHDAK